MATNLYLGRRLTAGAPTASARQLTLQATYASPPAATATMARTKFNARYVVTNSEDDGYLHAIQTTHALFKTLKYSDGTGQAQVPFALGLAPFGVNASGQEVHAAGYGGNYYTYDQLKVAYTEGAGVLNHSWTHQDCSDAAGYAASAQTWQDTMKTRTGIVMKGAVVPTNYAGYPKAFFDAGCLKVESQGTGGDYQLYDQYSEQKPAPFAGFPALGTRYVHRRVNLDLLGFDSSGNATDNRSTYKGYIDALVSNGTLPAKLGFFSHGKANEAYFTEFWNYVLSQCGGSAWFPSLDALGEYEQLLRLGVLTQAVSGNVLTVKLDYSAMPTDARWLDMSLLLPPGFSSLTVTGTLGCTSRASTGLVNLYNTAGQVPTITPAS